MSKKRHILIISFAYPPLSAIGARRISKISKELYDKGWIPHVISAVNPKDNFPSEIELPKDLVHHVDWIDLWNVFNRIEKLGKVGYLISQVLKKIVPFGTGSIPEIRRYWWIKNAVRKGVEIIDNNNIELIYSSFSPPASIRVANQLNRLSGIPWINEYRDLWTLNPYHNRNFVSELINRKLEKKYINSADALVTVSEPLRNDLISLFGKRTEVVYNGYDELDNEVIKKESFEIVYTGSIYVGRRDPRELFKAISILMNEGFELLYRLKVSFYGPNIPTLLDKLVKEYKISKYVTLSESISHYETVEHQRNACVLLLLGWNNKKDKGVVTGKFFEYIGRRKEILAITYPKGAVQDILEYSKLGEVLVESEQIAIYLKRKLISFNENNRISPKGDLNRLQKFSRSYQVNKLIELFKDYVS